MLHGPRTSIHLPSGVLKTFHLTVQTIYRKITPGRLTSVLDSATRGLAKTHAHRLFFLGQNPPDAYALRHTRASFPLPGFFATPLLSGKRCWYRCERLPSSLGCRSGESVWRAIRQFIYISVTMSGSNEYTPTYSGSYDENDPSLSVSGTLKSSLSIGVQYFSCCLLGLCTVIAFVLPTARLVNCKLGSTLRKAHGTLFLHACASGLPHRLSIFWVKHIVM